MQRRWSYAAVVAVVLLTVITIGQRQRDAAAQAVPTPTPLPLVFPTTEPLSTQGSPQPTDIPTFTPTEVGPPVLQAREGAGDINLRAEPDPSAEVVGTLQAGEQYEVTGRYFLWYRLRYDPARSRQAYVFGELVEIIGDEGAIPDLTIGTPEPTIDTTELDATETLQALQQTPGFDETQTASVRELAPPGSAGSDTSQAAGPALPTFTFPPDVAVLIPTREGEIAEPTPTPTVRSSEDGTPPIVPIGVMVGLGVLSFLVSVLLRRN